MPILTHHWAKDQEIDTMFDGHIHVKHRINRLLKSSLLLTTLLL